MQAWPNLVVVTTRFSAELEDGSTIYGSTNYPHYPPNQEVEIPYYQLVRVESVEQQLDGNRLYSKVVTRVLPFGPPADDAIEATVERVTALA